MIILKCRILLYFEVKGKNDDFEYSDYTEKSNVI